MVQEGERRVGEMGWIGTSEKQQKDEKEGDGKVCYGIDGKVKRRKRDRGRMQKRGRESVLENKLRTG